MKKKKTNKKLVIEKIDLWKIELYRLFDQIELWTKHINENIGIDRSITVTQKIEGPMEALNIAPSSLPTLKIYRGRKKTSFSPRSPWGNGIKSSVNVIGLSRSWYLVDISLKNTPDWRITTSVISLDFELLTKESFANIIK